MNRDSIKWLIAGLAGSFVTVAFLGTGAFLGIRFVLTELSDDSEIERTYGPDAWHEGESAFLAEKAEEDAALEASGLLDRYTVVSIYDDTREILFEQQDFATVEARMAAHYEAADTPLRKHRYSQHLKHLGNMYYGEDLEAQWKILSDWVDSRPESQLARVVRGAYAMDYAWYFRGNGYSHRVTDEGWAGFHRYLEIAREDLEIAHEMNPDDPEAPALLITVTSALGTNADVTDSYYARVLEINPLHYGARMAKLHYAQPVWGGSWEIIEGIIADCAAHQAEFPLFVDIIRQAERNMKPRGKAYENTWNSKKTKQMMYAGYLAQAQQSPDDLRVQADLASFAADLFHYDDAYAAMAIVGDRFPRNNRFDDLPNYHRWRGIVMAEYSRFDDIRDTPKEEELIEAAVALTPSEATVTGLYLAYLVRRKDDGLSTRYFETLEDMYLATGSWGAPPDYTVMDGMAKAARSDDWGFKGTKKEGPLLEEALALAPDNAFVRLVYAEHFISAKNYDDAQVHLEKARALDPDYIPALHIMGWLRYHQKRWDEGIAAAKAFLATAPSPYLDRYRDDAKEIIELCEKKKAGG